jgi:predicted nucleic acid-binding Zn ribbon protein
MGEMADYANECGDRAYEYYEDHPEERCEECGAPMKDCQCQAG